MAYVVVRDPRLGGHNHPTVVHLTRMDAEAEAQRLAERNRGDLFLVASFVSGVQLPLEKAQVVRYDTGGESDPWDEIPF